MTPAYFWWRSVEDRLAYGLQQQRVTHALLLTAVPGLGLSELAQRYAARLLCEAAEGFSVCGRCSGCAMFRAGHHPDLMHLHIADEKKSIGIDQIRELTLALQQTAHRGGFRVAIIEEADSMSVGAANALLKTLEEPGAKTVLMLLAQQAERLPATIRSRCQRLSLKVPAPAQALQWLQTQSQRADAELISALELANYAPLLALELLDDPALGQWQQQLKMLDSLLKADSDPVLLASRISAPEPWLDAMLRRCHTGMLENRPWPAAVWAELAELTLEARRQLRSASNLAPQAVLEVLCLRWFDLARKFGHSAVNAKQAI